MSDITTAELVLDRFEVAVREHEMLGAQHPSDHADIQSEYDSARNALLAFLQQVFR